MKYGEKLAIVLQIEGVQNCHIHAMKEWSSSWGGEMWK